MIIFQVALIIVIIGYAMAILSVDNSDIKRLFGREDKKPRSRHFRS